MAAIKKAKTLTDEVLKFDTPVDLDDALLRIELLTAAIKIGIDQIEKAGETIAELEHEKDELDERLEDAKAAADEMIEYVVEDLERARQWVKAGRAGDALHELDRILQEFDVACKRATVVAPMLPVVA